MTVKKLPANHKLLIGLRVRAVREVAGLNGVAFAASYGSGNQANWNREAGINRIAIDEAMKIEEVYGVPIEWIYMGVAARLYINDDAHPVSVLDRYVIKISEESITKASNLIDTYNRLVTELDQALVFETSAPIPPKRRSGRGVPTHQNKAKERSVTAATSYKQPKRPKVRKTLVALAEKAIAGMEGENTRPQTLKRPATIRNRQRSRLKKR